MVGELIYICGPDGVGKSTQAELLIEKLKKQGKMYEYRWVRFHHLLSLPLLVIARLMGLSEIETLKSGEKIGYHYFNQSKFISFLYPPLLFFDTLIYAIIKVYLPLYIFNKNLVCDRFVIDTLIDLMISTGKTNLYHLKIGKLYLNLIPEDTKILILITNERVLRSRRTDVMYDKNLKMKIKSYRKFLNYKNVLLVDASSPLKDVHEEICKKLGY